MNNNQFCTQLNLPDAILDNKILHLQEFTPYNVSENLLNPVVLEIIKSRGFEIDSVEIFEAGPNNPELKIHIDDSPSLNGGYVHEDIGKLNWIYGNMNCNMTWFREREGTIRKDSMNNFAPFIEFAREDVEEIASINIGRNAVIQAAIPHTVVNYTNDAWYCVGIHLKYPGFSKVPYNFIIDKFQEYVVRDAV